MDDQTLALVWANRASELMRLSNQDLIQLTDQLISQIQFIDAGMLKFNRIIGFYSHFTLSDAQINTLKLKCLQYDMIRCKVFWLQQILLHNQQQITQTFPIYPGYKIIKTILQEELVNSISSSESISHYITGSKRIPFPQVTLPSLQQSLQNQQQQQQHLQQPQISSTQIITQDQLVSLFPTSPTASSTLSALLASLSLSQIPLPTTTNIAIDSKLDIDTSHIDWTQISIVPPSQSNTTTNDHHWVLTEINVEVTDDDDDDDVEDDNSTNNVTHNTQHTTPSQQFINTISSSIFPSDPSIDELQQIVENTIILPPSHFLAQIQPICARFLLEQLGATQNNISTIDPTLQHYFSLPIPNFLPSSPHQLFHFFNQLYSAKSPSQLINLAYFHRMNVLSKPVQSIIQHAASLVPTKQYSFAPNLPPSTRSKAAHLSNLDYSRAKEPIKRTTKNSTKHDSSKPPLITTQLTNTPSSLTNSIKSRRGRKPKDIVSSSEDEFIYFSSAPRSQRQFEQMALSTTNNIEPTSLTPWSSLSSTQATPTASSTTTTTTTITNPTTLIPSLLSPQPLMSVSSSLSTQPKVSTITNIFNTIFSYRPKNVSNSLLLDSFRTLYKFHTAFTFQAPYQTLHISSYISNDTMLKLKQIFNLQLERSASNNLIPQDHCHINHHIDFNTDGQLSQLNILLNQADAIRTLIQALPQQINDPNKPIPTTIPLGKYSQLFNPKSTHLCLICFQDVSGLNKDNHLLQHYDYYDMHCWSSLISPCRLCQLPISPEDTTGQDYFYHMVNAHRRHLLHYILGTTTGLPTIVPDFRSQPHPTPFPEQQCQITLLPTQLPSVQSEHDYFSLDPFYYPLRMNKVFLYHQPDPLKRAIMLCPDPTQPSQARSVARQSLYQMPIVNDCNNTKYLFSPLQLIQLQIEMLPHMSELSFPSSLLQSSTFYTSFEAKQFYIHPAPPVNITPETIYDSSVSISPWIIPQLPPQSDSNDINSNVLTTDAFNFHINPQNTQNISNAKKFYSTLLSTNITTLPPSSSAMVRKSKSHQFKLMCFHCWGPVSNPKKSQTANISEHLLEHFHYFEAQRFILLNKLDNPQICHMCRMVHTSLPPCKLSLEPNIFDLHYLRTLPTQFQYHYIPLPLYLLFQHHLIRNPFNLAANISTSPQQHNQQQRQQQQQAQSQQLTISTTELIVKHIDTFDDHLDQINDELELIDDEISDEEDSVPVQAQFIRHLIHGYTLLDLTMNYHSSTVSHASTKNPQILPPRDSFLLSPMMQPFLPIPPSKIKYFSTGHDTLCIICLQSLHHNNIQRHTLGHIHYDPTNPEHCRNCLYAYSNLEEHYLYHHDTHSVHTLLDLGFNCQVFKKVVDPTKAPVQSIVLTPNPTKRAVFIPYSYSIPNLSELISTLNPTTSTSSTTTSTTSTMTDSPSPQQYFDVSLMVLRLPQVNIDVDKAIPSSDDLHEMFVPNNYIIPIPQHDNDREQLNYEVTNDMKTRDAMVQLLPFWKNSLFFKNFIPQLVPKSYIPTTMIPKSVLTDFSHYCRVCRQLFPHNEIEAFQLHIQQHLGENESMNFPYCTSCQIGFSSISDFFAHATKFHRTSTANQELFGIEIGKALDKYFKP